MKQLKYAGEIDRTFRLARSAWGEALLPRYGLAVTEGFADTAQVTIARREEGRFVEHSGAMLAIQHEMEAANRLVGLLQEAKEKLGMPLSTDIDSLVSRIEEAVTAHLQAQGHQS